MRKRLMLLLSIVVVSILMLIGCTSKSEEVSNNMKLPNPWVEVNDVDKINKQLGAKFEIVPPKGFKIEYMAMGLQELINDGTIKPSGKIIYKNGDKEITVQIVKCLDLFNYGRINYESVPNSSIHAFYDVDTKRIVYAQDDYTVIVDVDNMDQDFSLVGIAKIIK